MCGVIMINLTSLGLRQNCNIFIQNENRNAVAVKDVEHFILREFGVSNENYYLLCNGKKLNNIDQITEHKVIYGVPKLVGGKGGFGSMLRAIGAQIEKTTNREACRDLSGRRLRDINEEQRLKNWISQQGDREREAAERKKKKLEKLCREPKHDFKDESYNQARTELAEKISDSVEQGFKASGSSLVGTKRKVCDLPKKTHKKKKKLWIDVDEDDTTSDESDSAESNETKILEQSDKCLDVVSSTSS